MHLYGLDFLSSIHSSVCLCWLHHVFFYFHLNFSRTVIRKMMSPCWIWQGLWAAAQERRCLYLLKRGNSMNKTGGRRKTFVTRANAASCLSSCWAPSQSLLKPLLWGEIALWLWVLAMGKTTISFPRYRFSYSCDTSISGHRRVSGVPITLIKNKIKFSSYIRKFRGIGCKVIYD